MFDWGDLRYFLAIARSSTLSAAARSLNVDHVTVGRHLVALEKSLQTRLLDRLPNRFVLTPVGRRVLEIASQIEASEFAIERAVRIERSDLTGKIVVSAPPVLVVNLFSKLSKVFHDRHPGIQLSLSGDIRAISLNRGEADIAVSLDRSKEGSNVARRIGWMDFGLYAARNYIDGREPAAWEFIASDAKFDHVPHQKWLRKVAGPRPFVCRVGDITGQYNAACAGVGVAVLPRFLPGNSLVQLDIDPEPLTREIWLAVHKNLSRSPPVRAVIDFIIEAVAGVPALQRRPCA